MDDRVRIYELARKMNVPNQDIINILRELGYDIKSHSSTIDKQTVNQLTAAFSKKKKDQDEKPKGAKGATVKSTVPAAPVTQSKAPTTKSTTKAPAAKLPPPPPPPIVKPRVLSRYRPDAPAAEPIVQTPASDSQSQAQPTALAVTASAVQPGTQAQQPLSTQPGSASTSSVTQATATTQPAQTQATSPDAEAKVHQTVENPPVAAQTAASASAQNPPASGNIVAEKSQTVVSEVKEALVKSVSVEEKKAPEVEQRKPEPIEPPYEEPEPIGRPTGDSWSDSSKYAPRVIRKLDVKAKKPEDEKEVAKPAEEPAATVGKVEERVKGKDEKESDHREGRKKGKSIDDDDDSPKSSKPLSPSVPIRVAAPSQRATPPRPPKSHRQSPSDRHAAKKEDKQVKPQVSVPEVPKVITLTTSLTVQDLATRMGVDETEVIKRLFMKGVMRTVNQTVELELARDLAIEMEYEVLSEIAAEAKEAPKELSEEDKANLVTRPPVVTIMGHVDHGKTSLLDAIRQTKLNIADSEHGGITQHMGAYHVEVPDEEGHMRQIVFLDTPGHEAFTAMRARGAKVTDIAILVVAADDGVMPQTIEALDHAKAAGVPIIVAVNKIDKGDADPERVLTQLMKHDLIAEKYGGETVTVEVSAKKRIGLDNLLEMILLVSDILDLKANPEKPAEGVIVEAELSRGKGAVATALVENGTLREGDFIVAGSKCGRVRALFDDRGQRVKAAGPSMPVEVLGLDEVPLAGDRFEVVSDAQGMKILAESRKLLETRGQHHVTLESLHDLLESGEVKELNIIVKADVQGTAEAIADSVRKLSSSEVQTRVLRTASGDISENDVNLAASSNAIIVGFNVQPDQNAARVAENSGVDIRTYNIIYQITDDITSAVQGLLKPIREEIQIGQAEVRQIFKVGKGLMIAGCMVLSGKVQRSSIARIERNGQIIHEGKLDTLKRFKDDAKEVAQGFECGMSFDKFSDLQVGDKINSFIITETKREHSHN